MTEKLSPAEQKRERATYEHAADQLEAQYEVDFDDNEIIGDIEEVLGGTEASNTLVYLGKEWRFEALSPEAVEWAERVTEEASSPYAFLRLRRIPLLAASLTHIDGVEVANIFKPGKHASRASHILYGKGGLARARWVRDAVKRWLNSRRFNDTVIEHLYAEGFVPAKTKQEEATRALGPFSEGENDGESSATSSPEPADS